MPGLQEEEQHRDRERLEHNAGLRHTKERNTAPCRSWKPNTVIKAVYQRHGSSAILYFNAKFNVKILLKRRKTQLAIYIYIYIYV